MAYTELLIMIFLFITAVERDENGVLLLQIRCVTCTSGTQPSDDQSICLPCNYFPLLKGKSSDKGPNRIPDENMKACHRNTNCATIQGGVCIPLNLGTEAVYQVIISI